MQIYTLKFSHRITNTLTHDSTDTHIDTHAHELTWAHSHPNTLTVTHIFTHPNDSHTHTSTQIQIPRHSPILTLTPTLTTPYTCRCSHTHRYTQLPSHRHTPPTHIHVYPPKPCLLTVLLSVACTYMGDTQGRTGMSLRVTSLIDQ